MLAIRQSPVWPQLLGMFCLSAIQDTIPVEPADFNKDHEEHLRVLIQAKYVDRVSDCG